jgi:ribonuclease HII
MHCGVDEAGKGSVLGPMVVAAVGCRDQSELSALGVKDSKQLSPVRREEIFGNITSSFPYAIRIVASHEIDRFRKRMTMNELVGRLHADVIRELSPSVAFVDACDVNAVRYAGMVQARVKRGCRIVSEHHADETYPVVSAASIVAKVTRDREVTMLAGQFGPVGTGYPSDPETVAYLADYIGANGRAPPFARHSWRTVLGLVAEKEQSHLRDFPF